MKKNIVLGIVLILILFSRPSQARDQAFFITYGQGASTIEGDDDFKQNFFIKLPAEQEGKVFVRIFDADCGGQFDQGFTGKWDTITRFRLFGKVLTCSQSEGVLLTDQKFGEDQFRNNQWHILAEIDPARQEGCFRLVVEGVEGDDGNAFLVAISSDPHRNRKIKGVEVFSYAPTIRLPRQDVFAELRFFAPQGEKEYLVHNFDLSNAVIGIDTAFRSNLPVITSGQNKWNASKVVLQDFETNRLCAIRFKGGKEMPNDGSFYITNGKQRVPILAPIYLQQDNQPPVIEVSFKPLADCRTIVFDGSKSIDPDGHAMILHWDFGDNQHAQGLRVVHQYKETGRYNASIVVTDNSGLIYNSARKQFTVIVNQPPQAKAQAKQVEAPWKKIFFDARASSDNDGRITEYHWNFGDGHSAQGQTVEHIFKKPNFYTITLRVLDDSNSTCDFDLDHLKVLINAPPVVEIGPDRVAAAGEDIILSAQNSSDSDGRIVNYNWTLGDGTSKEGVKITHKYQKPGLYKVKIIITDDSGVTNNTANDTFKLIINAPPTALVKSLQTGAAGEKLVFDGSTSKDADGTITAFQWDLGDGSFKSGAKITHKYIKAGRYQARLIVKDNSGTSSDTAEKQFEVIINAPPVADSGQDQWVTASQVQFDGSGSQDPDGKIIKYSWDFGDNSHGTGISPQHIYQLPGVYQVGLTVEDDSGTKSKQAHSTSTITINHPPIADAGPDRSTAPGEAIIFSGLSSLDPDGKISMFRWDFGDGSKPVNGPKVTHTYKKAGKYQVSLNVHDNSGHANAIGFDEAFVIVNHPPIALPGPDLVLAPYQKVSFNGRASYDPDGKITAYQWQFSDGKKINKAKLNRQFLKPGQYTARLLVTDDSGTTNSTSEAHATIRVNHQPVANAGPAIHTNNLTVVFNGSRSIDADGDPLSYQWDFGDQSPRQQGVKAIHTYQKSGNYPVRLWVHDGTGLKNARASTSVIVKINGPPQAVIGPDLYACAGKPVLLDGSRSSDPESKVLHYSWDFGDKTIGQGLNPSHTYTKHGDYAVVLTVTDDSEFADQSQDQLVVHVFESPVAHAGPDQKIDAGVQVRFDGSGSTDTDNLVDGYFWDFGDGNIGGGINPQHIYTKEGIYRVILTVSGRSNEHCRSSDTDEMIVFVQKKPIFTIKGPQNGQPLKPVLFSVKGSKGQWDFGDGFKSMGETAEHSYAKPGDYLITFKSKTSVELKQRIHINAPPQASIFVSEKQKIYPGQLIIFNAEASFDPDGIIKKYDWDFGDQQHAEGIYSRHKYQNSGKYIVTLKVTDNSTVSNHTAQKKLILIVEAPPVLTINAPMMVCPGQSFKVSVKGAADAKYTWNFNGITRTGIETAHTYPAPGKYQILLEADNYYFYHPIIVNAPPKADAGHDRLASVKTQLKFNARQSRDEGKLTRFIWKMGDKSKPLHGMIIKHAYQSPGTYNIKLTVFDDSKIDCNQSEDLIKVRINTPPFADAGPDIRTAYTGGAADQLLFDGSKSSDADGDALTFFWDFGDDTNGRGVKVKHYFKKAGIYKVKLRVDDGTGLKSSLGFDQVKVIIRAR